MKNTIARMAWIGFFAVCGGSATAALVAFVVSDAPPWVAAGWGIGACAAAVGVWRDEIGAEEFRFTEDGALAVGWIAAFLVPPLGILIGASLVRRGNGRGKPLIGAASAVILAVIVAGVVMSI
jgi:hypothetical protein